MVPVGGWDLYAVHYPGDPGRTPLLLCSGIGTSSSLFEPLIEALDPGRPLVLFDAPGIGRSASPKRPYRFGELARALHALLQGFGYERADVLGISWGGGLAQQYAFLFPQACRRVVLVATATGMLMIPGSPRVLIKMASPRRHRDPEYARQIAGELYGGTARMNGPAVADQLHRGGQRTALVPYVLQLGALLGWTSLPFLRCIRQPTLVLLGDDDPIIPGANGTIMSRLLPAGRLHRYRGGHLALLSDVSELAPVIDAFLNEPAAVEPANSRRSKSSSLLDGLWALLWGRKKR